MPLFRRGKRNQDAGPEWAPTPAPDVSGSEGPPSSVRRGEDPSGGGDASSESWVPQQAESWSPPPADEPAPASDAPAPVSREDQPPPVDQSPGQPAGEEEPVEWEEPTRPQEPVAESGSADQAGGEPDQDDRPARRGPPLPWETEEERAPQESRSRVSV